MLKNWKEDLNAIADPEKIKISAYFFKTNSGEYAEHDQFIGISVPKNREVVKKYFQKIEFTDIKEMLKSNIHEYRFSAVLALVERYKKEKNEQKRQEIVDFYLKNAEYVNSWDLVDTSAPHILGVHLLKFPNPELLNVLSKTKNLWKNRMAIVATQTLIKQGLFADTLRLAEYFLTHEHDLIHKATGWMLREIGEKSEETLIHFLDHFATKMPRTALRYAIEKLKPELRKFYLGKK